MLKIPEKVLVNNRYAQIAEIAKQILGFPDPAISVDSKAANLLRTKMMRCDSDTDYDRFAESFARLYWLRNYWKAVHFFEYEYSPKFPILDDDFAINSFPKVIVLGAGSAADTMAFMAWSNEKFPLKVIPITLIDRSQKQLDLAKRLIKEVEKVLDKVTFRVSYQKLDVCAWNPEPNSADMVLMSHFLTENSGELLNLLKKAKYALRRRGEAIIIERERDAVWTKAAELFANMGISIYDTDLSNDKLSCLYPILKKEKLETITPHYVKASLPEKKYQAGIVMKYFQAWRFQSLDLINEIFSKDAIYDEKPGIEKTIRGIDGILNYWQLNPVLQKNIRVYVRNVAYQDNTVICAFEGNFDTPKQHIVIRGAMNFFIDPFTQKVNKLTEYFGTEKSSLRA